MSKSLSRKQSVFVKEFRKDRNGTKGRNCNGLLRNLRPCHGFTLAKESAKLRSDTRNS